MSEMRVVNTTGDTKIIWDAANPDEVAAAKTQYDSLVGKGFKAFSVGKAGKEDELLTAFDKDLERIILTPPVRGG